MVNFEDILNHKDEKVRRSARLIIRNNMTKQKAEWQREIWDRKLLKLRLRANKWLLENTK